MASNSYRRDSNTTSDSGISSGSTNVAVHPRYACYWLDKCRGLHEVDHCHARKNDLHGKLGIYYSFNNRYRRFTRDRLSNVSLEGNPTGCTMVNLLIYRKHQDQVQLLLVTKSLMDKNGDDQSNQQRQLLFALPSSNPKKKGERPEAVGRRALETVTDRNELLEWVRPHLQRFLFVDASVIYSLLLTEEHADLLTKHFKPNDEVHSLHWFPLEYVLRQLPESSHYLKQPAEGDELAQVRHSIATASVKLRDENTERNMWSVAALYLICIREHVQFNVFLQ